MSVGLSLTESQTLTALRAFLLAVLPTMEVFQTQTNRVPEPVGADYVTMTPGAQKRLATNLDGYADALFTGTIAANTLTISAVDYGTIYVGSPVLGVGVAANTVVSALGTGTGGVGTYTISGSPQTITSRAIACGVTTKLQPTQLTVQLDVHGPASADNAVRITGMFYDDYGVQAFAASGFDVTPLYAEDAKQMPFENGEKQIEQRWMIDVVVQCNPILTIAQEYADTIDVLLKEVDATYPPQ